MSQDWAYTFTAAKNDKGDLIIQGRAYFDRVVSTLATGEVVVLDMKPWKEKRTNAQNRLIWGTVYTQILDGLVTAGYYEPDERAEAKALIHEGLTAKYQGTVKDKVTGIEVRKFRSSKSTKQEFTEYVEWVARFAAKEYGVAIALPGEAA